MSENNPALDLDRLEDEITKKPLPVRRPPLPGPGERPSEVVAYAPRHVREAPIAAVPTTTRPPSPPAVPAEVASHDNHVQAAAAIEADAEVLRQHGLQLAKQVEDGIAASDAAMVNALHVLEERCTTTKAELREKMAAHNAAVADYLKATGSLGDGFRATAAQQLDYIKKADARVAAKRDAVLKAGEDAPTAAAARGEG